MTRKNRKGDLVLVSNKSVLNSFFQDATESRTALMGPMNHQTVPRGNAMQEDLNAKTVSAALVT